eukprot:gene6204-10210_t
MKQHKLQIHDEAFSLQEVIINPSKFKEIIVGDILKITQDIHSQSFVIKVNSVDVVKGITDISLSKDIITKNNLDPDSPVFVEKNSGDVTLSHLELRIKDQYSSGGDMWKFKKAIIGQTVYHGKYLEEIGMKASVLLMSRNGLELKSGLITEKTKITFRSPSGHIYWLIQMSKEMWEYSLNGDLHFEKSINFFGELYDKWAQEKVSHSVKFLLFSRYYVQKNETFDNIDSFYALNGKEYVDFYKFIHLDLKKTTREQLLIMLKKEFIDFPKQITKHSTDKKLINSSASEGNILEAMNLVFHQYEERHLNRDMQRTGHFIHILTAGQGLITINNPDIAYITQHIVITESFTVDLVCLSHPPTHGVPILRGKNDDTKEDFFIFAYWIDIMFYKNDSILSKKFIPSCRIPPVKKPSKIQVFNVSDCYPQEKAFKLDPKSDSQMDTLLPLAKSMVKKQTKMKKSTSHDDIFAESSSSTSPIHFKTPKKLTDVNLHSSPKNPDFDLSHSLGNSSYMNHVPKSYSPNVNFLIYCNPFDLAEFENQSFYIKKKSKQTKQWSHLFPTISRLIHERDVSAHNDSFLKMFEFQWKILIEPAVLPVTNDFWPSNDDLNDKYVDFTYSLTVEDPSIITEMIAQRLNHSFQLFDLGLQYIHTQNDGNVYHLSNEDELQTISFDPDDKDVIIIKRYESKSNEKKSIDYKYKMFFGVGFSESEIQLRKSKSYPWNHLDFILTETSMIGSSINPSTLQFHLIPNEKNSIESRISNFKQLLESVLSRSLIPENNSKFDVEMITEESEPKTSKMNKMKLISSKTKINAWAKTSCFAMRNYPIFDLKSLGNMKKMKNILCNELNFYPEEYSIEECDVFVHESGAVIIYCFETEFSWVVNHFESIKFDSDELYKKTLNFYNEMFQK